MMTAPCSGASNRGCAIDLCANDDSLDGLAADHPATTMDRGRQVHRQTRYRRWRRGHVARNIVRKSIRRPLRSAAADREAPGQKLEVGVDIRRKEELRAILAAAQGWPPPRLRGLLAR